MFFLFGWKKQGRKTSRRVQGSGRPYLEELEKRDMLSSGQFHYPLESTSYEVAPGPYAPAFSRVTSVTIPASPDDPTLVTIDAGPFAIDNSLLNETTGQWLFGSPDNELVANRDEPAPAPFTINQTTTLALYNGFYSPASLHLSWKSLLPPDIAATSLTWDTTQGGVDFSYKVSGADLTQDTTAQLYWASGTTTDTILEPAATPITIPKTTPVDQEQTVHLAPSDFPGGPAPDANYLLAVVDPDKKIAEGDVGEQNNVVFLALPDVALTDATTPDFANFQINYDVSNTDLPSLKLNLYLSSDDVLSSGDELLATAPVTDLSTGIDKVFTANLPRIPVGEDQRFVLVVANKDQDFFETDSSNNQIFAIPLLAVGDRINRMGDWGGPGTFPETSDDASGPYTGAILRGTDDFAKLVHLDTVWTPSPQFDFLYRPPGATPQEQAIDAEEDRLAQPSLLQPTSELVRLINVDSDRNPALWGQAIFSINEAYDSAGEHGTPPSLHYEGRALDIEPLAVSDARLSRLSGLAWLAGFDWVYYENDHHIHVSEHASFPTTINGPSLEQAISTALDLGRIKTAGIANSLTAKVQDIDRLLAQNDFSAAVGKLRAFSQEIQAQRGTHIDTHFADLLLDCALILEGTIKKRQDEGTGP